VAPSPCEDRWPSSDRDCLGGVSRSSAPGIIGRSNHKESQSHCWMDIFKKKLPKFQRVTWVTKNKQDVSVQAKPFKSKCKLQRSASLAQSFCNAVQCFAARHLPCTMSHPRNTSREIANYVIVAFRILQSLNQESLGRFPPPKMVPGYTRKWAQPPRSPWSHWSPWSLWRARLAACSMPLQHKEDMWRYNRLIFFWKALVAHFSDLGRWVCQKMCQSQSKSQ
jgi:hypothetical protein